MAELYQVETKRLKRQVRRNIDRFPEDFMFELDKEGFQNWRSQFGYLSWGGIRYVPMAFTEHGVLMLSSVFNSKRAIAVNIQVIRKFTKLREMLTDNLNLRLEIEGIKKKLADQTRNIELVFSYLDELMEKKENPKPSNKIGYKK